MIPPFNCEHGRQCVQCPNKIINEVKELLNEIAQIFNDVHNSFDGITVNNVVVWNGQTKVQIMRKENDNF